MKLIQVPARLPESLILKVKKKLKAQGLTWIALCGFLLQAYLDDKIQIGIKEAE